MILEDGINTAQVSRDLGVNKNLYLKMRIPFRSTADISRQRRNECLRRGTQGAKKASIALRDGVGHFKNNLRIFYKAL